MSRTEEPLRKTLLRHIHAKKCQALKAIVDSLRKRGRNNTAKRNRSHAPQAPQASQQQDFGFQQLGQHERAHKSVSVASSGYYYQLPQNFAPQPVAKMVVASKSMPFPADDNSAYPLEPLLHNYGNGTYAVSPHEVTEGMPFTPASFASSYQLGADSPEIAISTAESAAATAANLTTVESSPTDLIDPTLFSIAPQISSTGETEIQNAHDDDDKHPHEHELDKLPEKPDEIMTSPMHSPQETSAQPKMDAEDHQFTTMDCELPADCEEEIASDLETQSTYSTDSTQSTDSAESTESSQSFQPYQPSGALGVVDPYAAGLFLAEFDRAVGVPQYYQLQDQQRQQPPAPPKPPQPTPSKPSKPSKPAAAKRFISPFNPEAFAKWQNNYESAESFRWAMINRITQMMYVSGETGEPSTETTGIIEDIVRQQVVEILRNCTELAVRRGSRTVTINDLIFQIRDDAPKVSRLRTFLSWKDVRKNVKDSDEKGADADIGAGEDPVGGVVPGGPVDDTAKKNKKAKVGLPWEPTFFYSQEVPEREDEDDDEEEEMNHITLQRLRKADERTKAMTREEYVTWSEFRQASFTYRKGKRFREWAGFGVVTDSKPSDDIVDILGFLTFEMVQTLTEEALKIKEHEEMLQKQIGGNNNNGNGNGNGSASGSGAGAGGGADGGKDGNGNNKKRKLGGQGLFDPPSEGRTPVEPRHIQEAFRRLQARPKKIRAMLNGTRMQQRSNLRLI